MVITAISVNHNTSAYMELMLRSFDATHDPNQITSWELYDNASHDDTTALLAYAQQRGTPLRQSGYSTDTAFNSHGHVLRHGICTHPDSDYYLLLDADVVFTQMQTIPRLITALEAHPQAWAIAVCPSWDGVNEIPSDARRDNPDICDARLHLVVRCSATPCCCNNSWSKLDYIPTYNTIPATTSMSIPAKCSPTSCEPTTPSIW